MTPKSKSAPKPCLAGKIHRGRTKDWVHFLPAPKAKRNAPRCEWGEHDMEGLEVDHIGCDGRTLCEGCAVDMAESE